MVGEKGWQFSIKFDGNIIWQFWTKTVPNFLPLIYCYYSYWTRSKLNSYWTKSNPLCKNIGSAGKDIRRGVSRVQYHFFRSRIFCMWMRESPNNCVIITRGIIKYNSFS